MKLVYLKLAIVPLAVLSFVCSVEGQSISTDRNQTIKSQTESARTLAEASQTAADAVSAIPRNEIFAYTFDEDKIDSYRPISSLNKKNYYKTIHLFEFSKPKPDIIKDDAFQSNVTLGFNNPNYHLKKEIRVMGNFDLRFDNMVWGIANSATITLGYDLRKPLPKGVYDIKIKINYFAFSVGIPFQLK